MADEYHFTDRAEFERMIAGGRVPGVGEVFGSNYYGTAMSALEHAREQGTTCCWISTCRALAGDAEDAAGGVDLHPAAESAGIGTPAAQPQPGGRRP